MYIEKEKWVIMLTDAAYNNSPGKLESYITDNSDYEGGRLEDISRNVTASLKTVSKLLVALVKEGILTVDEAAEMISNARLV